MKTTRKTAIIVGILFITATVTYMIGNGYIEPNLYSPNYLMDISRNRNQVFVGLLLEFVNHLAVVCIPFLMFPIFKKHSESLALGYVVFRIVESITLIIGSISSLSLLTISQEFVIAGAPDVSYFQSLGSILLAARDWSILLGVNIIFALGALIFNVYLYQSKIIPRWLSGWGFVGAVLLLARGVGLLAVFGFNQFVPLTLPIWVQEMVFAVWLIVKGFNSPINGSGSVKQDTHK